MGFIVVFVVWLSCLESCAACACSPNSKCFLSLNVCVCVYFVRWRKPHGWFQFIITRYFYDPHSHRLFGSRRRHLVSCSVCQCFNCSVSHSHVHISSSISISISMPGTISVIGHGFGLDMDMELGTGTGLPCPIAFQPFSIQTLNRL